jgi:hypothetical protein
VGLLSTLASAGGTFVLPRLLASRPGDPVAYGVFVLACVPLLVLLVGVPCGLLECVLAPAVAGEMGVVWWSWNGLRTVLAGGLKWLTCFLAGPSVFAGAAVVYWLSCGEPTVVDLLILGELGVVGGAYWILALLAVTDRGRLRALNPVAVADLAHDLGWRGLGLVLVGAGVLLGHGLILGAGLGGVHNGELRGWLLLVGGWVSALFWGTFFCRLLGVWCHLRSSARSTAQQPRTWGPGERR